MDVQIDLYYAPHCSACGRIRPRLRRLVAEQGGRLQLRERDVVHHLEAAVRARVVRTPAIVVNGRVRLAGAVSDAALHALLRELGVAAAT